jgi:hypothetical protein
MMGLRLNSLYQLGGQGDRLIPSLQILGVEPIFFAGFGSMDFYDFFIDVHGFYSS